MDINKKTIEIIMAGGSFAGVETSAELAGLIDLLSWKNDYPREKIKLTVVEGTSTLMPGQGSRLAKDVLYRLRDLGVEVKLSSFITEVEKEFVHFSTGEKLAYDVMVWNTGVLGNSTLLDSSPEPQRGNRFDVDECFRISPEQNVFMLGDQSCYHDSAGMPLPGTATQAIDQGKYVARAIDSLLHNQTPPKYTIKRFPMIIPLGGKWAIYKSENFYIKGFFAYIIHQIAWFRYFASLLGWSRALNLMVFNYNLYSKND